MKVTIFKADTGQIVRVDGYPDDQPETALLNIGEGELAIEGAFPGDVYFIDVANDDEPTPYPEKPGPWAVFDYTAKEWTDPRTPADFEAELQAWRAGAKLTKLAFLQRCMAFGILTPNEAIQATTQVPDSFAAIVATMPPYERDMAALNWGGATEIDRTDPFILRVAARAGLSDELLDQLFGVPE